MHHSFSSFAMRLDADDLPHGVQVTTIQYKCQNYNNSGSVRDLDRSHERRKDHDAALMKLVPTGVLARAR